jgi:hypothetical protein
MSFSISGNAGIAGAKITYSGSASGSVSADNTGAYVIPGLLAGSYTLTPSLSGYTFSPTNTSKTVTASNVSGVNFVASNSSAWSVPDDRDSSNFPNSSLNLEGTQIYIVSSTDSRTAGAPIDSRTFGAPVDSRVSRIIPINCRATQV